LSRHFWLLWSRIVDLLKRAKAPITDEAWEQVDSEAMRVLKLHLAGRKIVDFSGPHGWKLGSVNTGRLEPIGGGRGDGVAHALRTVQPLVEVRAPFKMRISELDDASRGAGDLDLDPVIAVAERVAHAEDSAIFHGYKDAYDELDAYSESGYPLRRRVQQSIPEVTFVWAPALKGGGLLVSTRGGDYELTVGQDLSIGYASHDRTDVELYLTESFTFRVLEEKAAVFLKRAPTPARRSVRKA
jgi:uncharacterized linocin/CFP29 family protein